jgi:hypothetical protein
MDTSRLFELSTINWNSVPVDVNPELTLGNSRASRVSRLGRKVSGLAFLGLGEPERERNHCMIGPQGVKLAA